MNQTEQPPPEHAVSSRFAASYIMPIRRDRRDDLSETVAYLTWLANLVDVIVVDNSPPDVFAHHARLLRGVIEHVCTDGELATPNGKVGNVLTGVRRARHEAVIVADDDVRYDHQSLQTIIALLKCAHVVRPQNYFEPLPWHAVYESARILLNRVGDGDWPGTLGVRKSVLVATGGYDGSVLFENLELVRTVKAAGGVEWVPLNLYVRRIPPENNHFWSQRVRQAYDELARPWRFVFFLAICPSLAFAILTRRYSTLALACLTSVAAAEVGRLRAGGRRYFSSWSPLLAPAWLLERGVSTWIALGSLLCFGGVRYRGQVLRNAATPMARLRRKHAYLQGTLPVVAERYFHADHCQTSY